MNIDLKRLRELAIEAAEAKRRFLSGEHAKGEDVYLCRIIERYEDAIEPSVELELLDMIEKRGGKQ